MDYNSEKNLYNQSIYQSASASNDKKLRIFFIAVIIITLIATVSYLIIKSFFKAALIYFSNQTLWSKKYFPITYLNVEHVKNVEITYDDNSFIQVGEYESIGRYKIIYQQEVTSITEINFNVKYNSNKTQSLKLTLNNNTTISFNEAEDYIYQRSFSITNDRVLGTGWIISSCNNINDQYEYYLATNWHVKLGFGSSAIIKYGVSRDKKTMNYTKFRNFSWESESNFVTNGNPQNAIDFYVAKVSFNNTNNLAVKSNLDSLNYYLSINNKINDFTSIDNQTDNFSAYIAGYPYHSVAKWECQNYHVSVSQQSEDDWQHSVDDNDSIIDNSLQCLSNWTPYNELSGGASGSMAIKVNEQNEIQIYGIYWGLWTNDYSTGLHATSVFTTTINSQKNYIEPYNL